MIRKIIHIDEEKCNGCGLCAEACHEGAIEMVAQLTFFCCHGCLGTVNRDLLKALFQATLSCF